MPVPSRLNYHCSTAEVGNQAAAAALVVVPGDASVLEASIVAAVTVAANAAVAALVVVSGEVSPLEASIVVVVAAAAAVAAVTAAAIAGSAATNWKNRLEALKEVMANVATAVAFWTK